jgi:hypothetical protein
LVTRYSNVLISILIAVICSSVAYGQDGVLSASADPARVAAGEQFQVSFIFSGSDYNNVKNFKAPNFGQLVVVSGPNQSTNMQWVNGQVSASIKFNYILYARQPGKINLGSASVEYKGKTLKSEPILIEITQGKPKQQSQSDQSSIEAGDNIIIKAVADKQRVRQGEQLIVTYKLYWRI